MNGNEAAYPNYFFPEQYNPEFGLTKRELIAAMAMQGLVAKHGTDFSGGLIGRWAIGFADALIERLKADPAEGASNGK